MAADSQHPGVVGKCLSWIDLLAGTRADFVIASGRWALSYLMGDNTSFLHFEATEFWFGWRFFFPCYSTNKYPMDAWGSILANSI